MQGNKTNWDPFKFKTTTSSFKKNSPLQRNIFEKVTDFLGFTEYDKMEEETKKAKQKLKGEIKQFRELPEDNIYADFQNLAAGQQNVYSGMENVFEDATIDQRAAEFASQQAAQQQANILSSLQAGGSFTAGNIQAILGLRAGQLQSAQAAEQAYDPIGDFIGNVGEIAGAATSIAALASDVRLKKNIKLVGKSPSNINIYNFEYIDSKYGEGVYQGVMANEVPFASILNEDGYYMVDYDVIDVDFKKL